MALSCHSFDGDCLAASFSASKCSLSEQVVSFRRDTLPGNTIQVEKKKHLQIVFFFQKKVRETIASIQCDAWPSSTIRIQVQHMHALTAVQHDKQFCMQRPMMNRIETRKIENSTMLQHCEAAVAPQLLLALIASSMATQESLSIRLSTSPPLANRCLVAVENSSSSSMQNWVVIPSLASSPSIPCNRRVDVEQDDGMMVDPSVRESAA